MDSHFSFYMMLSLAMFAITLEARPGPVATVGNKKPDCHTLHSNDSDLSKEEKSFVKDFEPRPNVSAYNEDASLKEGKMFVNDFEPRPNVSAYSEDASLKDKNTFAKDFEPRPNVSIYKD